jgi:hypothetical protein
MATATGRRGGGFLYRVSFSRVAVPGGKLPDSLAEPLSCAYQASDTPAVAGQFEGEGVAKDRILVPRWLPDVSLNMWATLLFPDGETERTFTVTDVLPEGNGPDATLLLVTPR